MDRTSPIDLLARSGGHRLAAIVTRMCRLTTLPTITMKGSCDMIDPDQGIRRCPNIT